MVQTLHIVEDEQSDELVTSTKVLIVDDEPDIVEEVIDQLEDEGIECLSAFNAKSAMELVDADSEIGVVVTDIRMPGMNGLEMARQMKANLNGGRDLFVIVVTGHAGMKEAVEALQIGAEDFLTKPLSPDHLLHSVRRAGEMVHLRQYERHFQQILENEILAKTTKLNETMQKLATANRIKDEFMAAMGHELRTPLNAINGFTEFLKEKLKDVEDKTINEYLDYIMDSGSRLSDTIENILEFSESISGKRKTQVETLVLEDIFGHALGQHQKEAEEKNIIINIEALPRDQSFDADRMMLMRALECILGNAVKFSPEESIISIGVKQSPGMIALCIKDNGPGMSVDEIAIARQPLSQVDGSLIRKAEGSGIGLSLAILLSELQGGSLEIESMPGSGTTVSIILPQG
ncbi:MAG: hybrid sensor histidine kinase/response regulator [Rhodospirillaceae bacterium]|nr:hybrid sensor histidine kinase/response regulator [Rhodospirillaceae bacterium]